MALKFAPCETPFSKRTPGAVEYFSLGSFNRVEASRPRQGRELTDQLTNQLANQQVMLPSAFGSQQTVTMCPLYKTGWHTTKGLKDRLSES